MKFSKILTIAVDFDGTIVEDAYPKVGKARMFAFETLKALRDDGHRIILWTYRHGNSLDEAVEFCKKNGFEFYAVNNSYPGEEYDNTKSRKILADYYIDDRNIGGVLGWGEVYQLLSNENTKPLPKRKKGFFSRF